MTYAVAAVLLLVGVALFVSAPLYGQSSRPASEYPDARRERLEHERAQAVHGLRELDFDRCMNKLSRVDYDQLRGRLEARALRALTALDRLKAPPVERPWFISESRADLPAQDETELGDPAASRGPILLLPDKAQGQSASNTTRLGQKLPVASNSGQRMASAAFCPACGVRLNTWAKFCSACGTRLYAAR